MIVVSKICINFGPVHLLPRVILCNAIILCLHAYIAFLYNPVYKCIAMGTEQLSLLRQVVPDRVRVDIVQSHSHPLASVRYSHCFNQIISACEGGVSLQQDCTTN